MSLTRAWLCCATAFALSCGGSGGDASTEPDGLGVGQVSTDITLDPDGCFPATTLQTSSGQTVSLPAGCPTFPGGDTQLSDDVTLSVSPSSVEGAAGAELEATYQIDLTDADGNAVEANFEPPLAITLDAPAPEFSWYAAGFVRDGALQSNIADATRVTFDAIAWSGDNLVDLLVRQTGLTAVYSVPKDSREQKQTVGMFQQSAQLPPVADGGRFCGWTLINAQTGYLVAAGFTGSVNPVVEDVGDYEGTPFFVRIQTGVVPMSVVPKGATAAKGNPPRDTFLVRSPARNLLVACVIRCTESGPVSQDLVDLTGYCPEEECPDNTFVGLVNIDMLMPAGVGIGFVENVRQQIQASLLPDETTKIASLTTELGVSRARIQLYHATRSVPQIRAGFPADWQHVGGERTIDIIFQEVEVP